MTNIPGTAGNDTLTSSQIGKDTLTGYAGDDLYNISSINATVVEAANTAKINYGNDTIHFSSDFNIGTTKAYTLAANVENLDLKDWDLSTNTAFNSILPANRFVINGNTLNDTITLGDKNSSQIAVSAGSGNDTVIGGAGDNYIDGGVGNDSISGGAGNDFIYGGADAVNDILDGGDGDDTYLIRDSKDTIKDTLGTNKIQLDASFTDASINLATASFIGAKITGINSQSVKKGLTIVGNANSSTTIFGGAGSNIIYGGTAADYIDSGAGNDTIYSGGGGDTLIGGTGNDTYVISDLTNDIRENAGGGTDTIYVSGAANPLNLQLYANIENVNASSLTVSATIAGNSGVNTITGSSQADFLYGGNDNGVIDTLIGGEGGDTYLIQDTKDVIAETAKTGGVDTIELGQLVNGIPVASLPVSTYNLNNIYIEKLDASLYSTSVTLTGNTAVATSIIGGSGDDTITDGTAADYLEGGGGNDTYKLKDAKDTIVDTSGTNKIQLDAKFAGTSINLNLANFATANISEIDASLVSTGLSIWGDANSPTKITTGTGKNTIYGGNGADILIGGKGDDTYVLSHFAGTTIIESATAGGGTDTIKIVDPLNAVDLNLDAFANVENIDASSVLLSDTTLTGNAGINVITGSKQNDTIYGGNDNGAKDTLIGGEGGDTYIIQDLADTITENGTSGVDTIELAQYDKTAGAYIAPNLTSYTLANTKIEKLDGHLYTTGVALTGNAATATSIIGGSGADTITDGTAADYLEGGGGADTYILKDAKDTIVDTSGNNKIVLDKSFTDGGIDLTAAYASSNITTIDASAITLATKSLTLTGNANVSTTIIGGAGNNIITGGTKADSLNGGAGNDIISGGGGIDYISGGAGNDTLYGGDGATSLDILVGGTGDDTYIVDDLFTDADIQEGPNAGNDTIKLTSSFLYNEADLTNAKFANIENLDASSVLVPHVTLTGNSLNNILTGTNSSDVLIGGGGTQADTLVGGKGSDIYFVSNSNNVVTEKANEGYDKVILDEKFNSNTFSVGANVEFLDATAVRNGSGMTLNSGGTSGTTIYATSLGDTVKGGDGDDIINGYAGNDVIYGGAGNDTIDGGDGADYINGGAGDDTLYGSGDNVPDSLFGDAGNDVYMLKDTKDVITDTLGGNTIRLNELFTASSLSLANNAVADDGSKYDYSAAHISMLDAHFVTSHGLTLTGSNALNKIPTTTTIPASGNVPAYTKTTYTYTGVNTLIYGTDFNDIITSYSGDDTLYGSFGDSTLYGWGDDTLYGGSGTNTLLGGLGNDTYLIDGTATATTITELSDTTTIKYGTDTVKLIANNGAFTTGVNLGLVNTPGKLSTLDTFSYTLADNVEILDASLIIGTDLTLKGNDVKGGNTIIGGAGNDTITGGGDVDTLYGGNGNDVMEGGKSGSDGGVNTLEGGNGDDTYNIKLTDEESIKNNAWKVEKQADGTYLVAVPRLLTKFSDSSGTDTIVLTGKDSYDKQFQEMFDLVMPDTIENLDAGAISKDLELNITGNDLDNVITGGTGYDHINSGAGDDTIYDYKKYTDGNGVWWFTGNQIDAGSGNNTVVTGFGDDIITATDGVNFITDLGGNNTITLGLYQNGDEMPADGNNRVYTSEGNDTISTGSGDDYIVSGGGDDTLNGGTGTNTLFGGAGNDTYIINSATDFVTEEYNAGNDTLQLSRISTITSIVLPTVDINSDALYANVENINGSASVHDLTLIGNAVDNSIEGGTGKNTLIGGDGNDTYGISGRELSTTITETSGNDTIELKKDKYGHFNGLASASFSLAGYSGIENLDASSIDGVDTTVIPPNTPPTPTPTDLMLTGNILNNIIRGGQGNDTIDGGGGTNVLFGEDGNDTYIIDDLNDTITEASASGNDTLQLKIGAMFSSVSLAGYANIENIDGSQMTSALALTGNELDNSLIGGSGSNKLVGGGGNDTYVVNTASDITTEAVNNGNDTLKLSSDSSTMTSVNLNSVGYTNIENIDGSSATQNLILTGTGVANTLIAGLGTNSLIGGNGNDTYVINSIGDQINETVTGGNDTVKLSDSSAMTSVNLNDAVYDNIENIDGSLSFENLTLTGDASANIITGSSNSDIIFGGTGANTLIGGKGDDIYRIDGNSTSTTIIELADTKTDSYGTDTLELVADGSGKFCNADKYAASLADYANIEIIDGYNITNTDLTLTGNSLDNTIIGGSGSGLNTLIGGAGNDTYYISKATDVITEAAGGGTDEIVLSNGSTISTVDLSKYANVENIDGSASGNTITLTGSDGNNTLIGNGSSTLTGGKGDDTYIILNSGGDNIVEKGGEGIDTIKLSAVSLITSVDLAGYSNIENIDGSWSSKNLGLTGDKNDNIITGGTGNDIITSGAGKDTLNGGRGADTYSFYAGDAKDLIVATDAADIINIDTSTGMTTADMLFYTDAKNNLYIDYTEGGLGSDVAEITAGNYNKNTTIQVGANTIDINSIISHLTAATSGLDAAAISALDSTAEANQYAILTTANAWLSNTST